MADTATKTVPNATDVADPAKSLTGGRKPGDTTADDLKKMTPEQQVGTLKDAVAQGKEEKDSSLKIRIELDIDVEVHLTARIKGDITIGLL